MGARCLDKPVVAQALPSPHFTSPGLGRSGVIHRSSACRHLVVGGNWFVFGLPQDIKAVLNSGLIKRSDSGMGLRDYSTKQDLCMGLSTAAMESHFDNPSGEARHLHDLEWLVKGGTKQVQSAIKGFGPQLKKALLGDDGLLMGQTLASASLVYRPFCLAHKNHGTK